MNDMSLPFGGTFDIGQNWQPPHSEHSRGKAVDVRGNGALYAIPNAQQPEFRQICIDKGASLAITDLPVLRINMFTADGHKTGGTCHA